MKPHIRLLLALGLALLLTACVAPAPSPAEVEETLEASVTPEVTEAVKTVEETPTEQVPVYTDWSKLEPYQPRKAVYTRRYEDFTDTLIPEKDYGPLIPFEGAAVTGMEMWNGGASYYDHYLYGLVTLQGEVVVDPVFTSVERVRKYDHFLLTEEELPVYVLTRLFDNGEGLPEERSALCALDGSWCTGYLYRYGGGNSGIIREGTGLIIARGRDKFALVNLSNGREEITIDLAPYLGEGDSFSWKLASGGYITVTLRRQENGGTFFLLFAPDGTLLLRLEKDESLREVYRYEGGLLLAQATVAGAAGDGSLYGYMDLEGSWAVAPSYLRAEGFHDGLALVQDQKGYVYFINKSGIPVTQAIRCDHFYRHGDYWYLLDSRERPLAVYDLSGQPVEGFPTVGVGQIAFLEESWVSFSTAETLVVARGPELYRFPAALGKVAGLCGEGVLIGQRDTAGRTTGAAFVTWEGETLSRWDEGNDVHLKKDALTGESYVTVEFYGENGECRCYDLEGTFVASGEGNYGDPRFFGGLLHRARKGPTTLTTREGETVFCWPVHSAAD